MRREKVARKREKGGNPVSGQAAVVETPMVEKSGWVGLWVLLAVSLFMSVVFAVKVPLEAQGNVISNPDEVQHWTYIKEMIAQGGFVKFVPDPTYRLAEVHQSPLYYLLALPVHLLSGGNLVAVRLVNAVIQCATIAVAFVATRRLFPTRAGMATWVAAFVTFLPTQAQLAGSINNDPLTALLCVALFWRFAIIGFSTTGSRGVYRESLIVGVLFGLALLTKLSVLQLVPALLVAYLWALLRKRLTFAQAVSGAAIALGLGVVIASPWLVRNQMLYGHPLALTIYKQTGPNFTPEQMKSSMRWSDRDYAVVVILRSFATFWYFLPPILLLPTDWTPFTAVLVIALGGLVGLYLGWRDRDAQTQGIVAYCALGAALLLPFFVQFVYTVFQAQGRYFLPALLPIAVVAVFGWEGILPRIGRYIAPVVLAVICLFGLFG